MKNDTKWENNGRGLSVKAERGSANNTNMKKKKTKIQSEKSTRVGHETA